MNKDEWVNYIHERLGIDKSILEQEYDNNYKPADVQIYNSVHEDRWSLPADIFLKEVNDQKIISESGAFFLNHDVEESLCGKAIRIFKDLRSVYKKEMFKAKEVGDLIGESIFNGSQKDTKISMNTQYGIQANPRSKYYNYDVSSSITIRGRSTVSMNGLNLESTFADYRPYSLIALTDFIIKNKNKEVPQYILDMCPVPSIEDLAFNVLKIHYNDYYAKDVILDRLSKLTDDERKKVFYACNFESLVKLDVFKNTVREIFIQQNSVIDQIKELELKQYKKVLYLDPSNAPEAIKDKVQLLSDLCKYLLFGFSWYEGDINKSNEEYISPEYIFRNMYRKIVVITDTDSLIMTLKKSMSQIIEQVPDYKEITKDIPDIMNELILSSFVINASSIIISEGLWKYTTNALIPERVRHNIEYKQEFYFRTLQPTNGAKNYIAIITEQEGVYLPEEEVEIKGLSLKKANFNKYLSDKAKHIAANMIAKVKLPDIIEIFKEIDNVRKEIPKIFRAKNNLDVFTVSKLKGSYAENPKGDFRQKAVDLYNYLFDDTISLPGSFLICKIDLDGKEEIIEEKYPEIYKKLMKVIDIRNKEFSLERMYRKATSIYGEIISEEANDILDTIKDIEDIEELRNFIRDTKKIYKTKDIDEKFKNFINNLSIDNKKLKDIDRIALPLETEFVPEFISSNIDINELAVFENLIAVLVNGLGFMVIRNKDNRQIIHNVVNYY